ncbi:hypothetical protein Tco_1035047 [Tanacetum coccineum]
MLHRSLRFDLNTVCWILRITNFEAKNPTVGLPPLNGTFSLKILLAALRCERVLGRFSDISPRRQVVSGGVKRACELKRVLVLML